MSNSNKSKMVPGIGRIPFPAYRGDEPYIFVSYAHKDAKRVFAEIKRFYDANYHVWYDEGIAPGNEWADEIERALSNCALFVVFLTKASVDSENVADEINLAIDEKKPAIAVYLEECELKGGLKLRFKRKQAIMRYEMTEEEYVYKYTTTFDDLLGRESPPPALPVPVPFGEKVKRFFAAHKKAVAAVLAAVVLAGAGFGIFAMVSNGAKETAANNSVSATVAETAALTQQSSAAENAVNDGSSAAQTMDEEDWEDLLSAEPTPLSSFEIDEGESDAGTYKSITKFIGTETEIVIPSGITAIAENAFSNTHIKSVVITHGVNAIWGKAFFNCSSLKKVYIADSVTEIGTELFHNDTNLSDVRWSKGLNTIPFESFMGCSSLVSFEIPNSVEEIGTSAFEGCTSLKKIVIPSNVKKLNVRSFQDCTSMEVFEMCDGLTEICSTVFKNNTAKELIIPTSVKAIDNYAFTNIYGERFYKGIIIVHKGSYAEKYMTENNLDHELID